eukprot:6188770-Pleurochrysis_carterae.AAC.2
MRDVSIQTHLGPAGLGAEKPTSPGQAKSVCSMLSKESQKKPKMSKRLNQHKREETGVCNGYKLQQAEKKSERSSVRTARLCDLSLRRARVQARQQSRLTSF